MNLTTNKHKVVEKWDLVNTTVEKHTFEKTQACKNINTKWISKA